MYDAPNIRNPILSHLLQFADISTDENAALDRMGEHPQRFTADQRLYTQHGEMGSVLLITSGWAIRHKDLPDGRRQILDFVVPGDIVGMEGLIQETADHSVTTLNEVVASPVSVDELNEAMRRHPGLTRAVMWMAMRQVAVFNERLLTLGRRSATERIAHLILEMWRRLNMRNLADGETFHIPVTQAVMAEVIGVSDVHISRCLQQLQRDGIVSKRRQRIEIHDIGALMDLAQFDERYLGIERTV